MAAVHERVNLNTAENGDVYRQALVMVDDDPADDVTLDVDTLGLRFNVRITRAQSRELGALLMRAGEA